ncbi:HtaA domain-containing protein [Nocardioides zeae]|uniref:HtaA domain-containing protein n=1 Tax=Nocardioides imazamoxiresistens TaxID=3231893 RepID=A0ABU3PWV3_9ACTN|nr:HtaA domain-containing protein [Nocardioides zeae]MDT9593718.1 HtaA domain-containing protein [Nocardioides zeae]
MTSSPELPDIPDTPSGAPPHGLRWGVKASFVEYVRRSPGGKGSVSDGAVPVGATEVLYALAPTPPEAPAPGSARAWAFLGDVRFAGHGGMMFVRLAAPWVEVGPTGALLSIEDPHGAEGAPRVPLAELTLREQVSAEARADGVELWTSDDVRLTAQGAALFNDVYAPGETMDPLSVVVPIGSGAVGGLA